MSLIVGARLEQFYLLEIKQDIIVDCKHSATTVFTTNQSNAPILFSTASLQYMGGKWLFSACVDYKLHFKNKF